MLEYGRLSLSARMVGMACHTFRRFKVRMKGCSLIIFWYSGRCQDPYLFHSMATDAFAFRQTDECGMTGKAIGFYRSVAFGQFRRIEQRHWKIQEDQGIACRRDQDHSDHKPLHRHLQNIRTVRI